MVVRIVFVKCLIAGGVNEGGIQTPRELWYTCDGNGSMRGQGLREGGRGWGGGHDELTVVRL